jgi:predicted O-methyltransferase YrrM
MQTPPRVAAALERAAAAGFRYSCEPETGALLAVLAGAVRPGGRIVEIGTGAGVGLAWLVSGLGSRTDVELVSVELDPATHELAAGAPWPSYVRLLLGDVLALPVGDADLIFADAQGGKWTGLDRTVAALRPGGVLLVDDMRAAPGTDPAVRRAIDGVRETLLSSPELNAVAITWASGLILCSRRA